MGNVHLEVLDGGLGITPASGDELHAVIGVSSAGVNGTLIYTRDPAKIVESKGYGPGPQAAALNASLTGLPLVFGKLAKTTAGKVVKSDAPAVNIASSTNATPTVITTSTPHKLADGAVVIIAGHLVNTNANGTFAAHVLTSTTFSLPGIAGNGIGVATGTVHDTGVTSLGAGTSVPTVTGEPVDSMQIRWQWIVGGTRGAAGATFRYSKDDGATWSPVLTIGASTSYSIPNSGISVAFSAGTWLAGEEWRLNTKEPLWAISDVIDMLDTLRLTGYKFRLIELVGEMQASDMLQIATKLEELKVKYRYTRVLGHARDFDTAVDVDFAAYEAALANDVAALDVPRVSSAAGYYRVPSVIDKCQYRRPALFSIVPRIMSNPIQVSPGKVRPSGGGSLKNLNSPSQSEIDSKGLSDMTYLDTDESPTLKSARYMTLRKRVGRPGWFVDNASTFAGPTSDYTELPLCFVIDKASDLTYEWLVDLLDDDIALNPDTGFILETEAQGEEARAKGIFRTQMTSKRNCTSVTALLDRDDEILTTKTITAKVRVIPRGYVKEIVVDVGYTNPQLALA